MIVTSLADIPQHTGASHPVPAADRCRARRKQRLGDAVGMDQFGVNRVELDPGVWSTVRHWHSHEDEFAMVLEGELTLVTDAGEEILRPGDNAGFAAGVRDGHTLQNRSDKDALVLVIGSRDDADWGEYSDIDMKFLPGRYSGGGGYARKNGDKL
jgi:uncharacterized cupin superfamily protein